MWFVHGQNQNSGQKRTTKKVVEFHNHLHMLAMVQTVPAVFSCYLYARGLKRRPCNLRSGVLFLRQGAKKGSVHYRLTTISFVI